MATKRSTMPLTTDPVSRFLLFAASAGWYAVDKQITETRMKISLFMNLFGGRRKSFCMIALIIQLENRFSIQETFLESQYFNASADFSHSEPSIIEWSAPGTILNSLE